MKKFKKFMLVAMALFTAIAMMSCDAKKDDDDEEEKNIPAELKTSNANEVLGENYKNKSSISIPNGVLTIGDGVFRKCTVLVSISIPSTVTKIDNGGYLFGAFEDCTALKTVTFSENLAHLGSRAFSNCKALNGVTLPKSLLYAGEGLFQPAYLLQA